MSSTRFTMKPHTIYSCLNVKELLAQSSHNIWTLSDRNGTRIHDYLVRKRTLSHLVKLAKWLSCVVSTFLYVALVHLSVRCTSVIVCDKIIDATGSVSTNVTNTIPTNMTNTISSTNVTKTVSDHITIHYCYYLLSLHRGLVKTKTY